MACMATATRGRPRSFDRDAVLDKAIRLFWRRGYEATSMRDLVSELGVAAPSLYRTFGDKEQLFAEVVGTYDRHYGGFIDLALAEEPTARAAAARILREGPGRYTRPGLPTGCLIVSGASGTTNEVVAAQLSGMRASKVEQLAARIEADIDSGELPQATDAVALARYTMAILTGIAEGARDGVSRSELDQVAQVALRAWP
jgi:AcrR family transcriptional regulator